MDDPFGIKLCADFMNFMLVGGPRLDSSLLHTEERRGRKEHENSGQVLKHGLRDRHLKQVFVD